MWNSIIKWYCCGMKNDIPFKVLQKKFPSLSPLPPSFFSLIFPFAPSSSSFLLYLLAMAIWVLAMVCTYPYLCQPCSHPNCLTLIVCMAAGPLEWRMCSMADAAGRFSSSIMANSVSTTHDRPYPSIQLKREGRTHQCVYSILDTPLHCPSHRQCSGLVCCTLLTRDRSRQEATWERVGMRTSLTFI